MTIIILEKVPAGLRGELSKWMLEVSTGVFVGKLSRLVREKLWLKVCEKSGGGSAYILWKTNTEQGFDILSYNLKDYIPVDFEGMKLIMRC